jgi:phosphate starvation-inducible PhoH-like protein
MKKNKKNKHLKITEFKPITPNENVIDQSPIIYQRSKLKAHLNIRKRSDLTENQKRFLGLASDKNVKIIFVSGPAGTSKTFLAVMASLQLLNDKRVSDLIYLRSVVESSEKSMGYLPGSEGEKLAPYIQPLMDKLEELLPKNDIDLLMKEERVQGHPINFLRGLSWNAKSIVVDESQNMSYKELFTLITRVGEFSKLFILGDPEQSDIKNSGFIKMMECLNDQESRDNGIFAYKFNEEDIVRSQLVKFIIKKIKNLS